MKQLIRLLFKIGIPVAIIYAAHASNPSPAAHRKAIDAKNQSLQDADVLGKMDRMMYSGTEESPEMTYNYHNYFVCSKVTGPGGATASYGFFKRVFVTKSEL